MTKFLLLAMLAVPFQASAYYSNYYDFKATKRGGALYLTATAKAPVPKDLAAALRSGKYELANTCLTEPMEEATAYATYGDECTQPAVTGCIGWNHQPFCGRGESMVVELQNEESLQCVWKKIRFLPDQLLQPNFKAVITCRPS